MSFLDQFDDRLETIDQREAEIQATVQERLDELARERAETVKARGDAIFQYLSERAPEELLKAETAAPLYALGFDGGLGNGGFNVLYEKLVEGSYLSAYPIWWSLKDETALVKIPTMVYEDHYDEGKLSRSMKLLEALYEAAREINSTVFVEFYREEGLFKAKRDDSAWNLHLPNGRVKTNYGSLSELFNLELRGR